MWISLFLPDLVLFALKDTYLMMLKDSDGSLTFRIKNMMSLSS